MAFKVAVVTSPLGVSIASPSLHRSLLHLVFTSLARSVLPSPLHAQKRPRRFARRDAPGLHRSHQRTAEIRSLVASLLNSRQSITCTCLDSRYASSTAIVRMLLVARERRPTTNVPLPCTEGCKRKRPVARCLVAEALLHRESCRYVCREK